MGLFDTNENKTDEVIRLLRTLTDLYVPLENEEVVDAVFFGGTLSVKRKKYNKSWYIIQ